MWHRKAPPSIDISILARGASFLYALFDYGFTLLRFFILYYRLPIIF
ncbi:hypothetical protein [Ornithinibacillus sp. FSL M8-0202]